MPGQIYFAVLRSAFFRVFGPRNQGTESPVVRTLILKSASQFWVWSLTILCEFYIDKPLYFRLENALAPLSGGVSDGGPIFVAEHRIRLVAVSSMYCTTRESGWSSVFLT